MKFCHILGLTLVLLTACQIEKKDNSTAIAADNVAPLPLKIVRFDQELRQIDTANLKKIEQSVTELSKKYADFAPDYFGGYMQLIDPRRSANENMLNLKGFLTHPPIRRMLDTIQVVYPDMTAIEQEMGGILARFQKEFPDQKVPKIYSLFTEYTNAVVSFSDSVLCFSPEFFLGAYDKHYPSDAIPQYVARGLDRTHLPGYLCEQMLDNIMGSPKGNRLLDIMIHNGKKLYAMHQLMPTTPDSVLLRITAEQTDWCHKNEIQLWSHLTTENLLYETDSQKTKKLVSPAPNVPGIPSGAPGGVANFIGWRIIESYMEQRPNTTLSELLGPATTDGQKILEASKFKPKKG